MLKQLKKVIILALVLGICVPDSIRHITFGASALAAHYFHHITAHEFIGIGEFLALHDKGSEHMQADAHEHKHLPGSDSKQHCQHAQVITGVPSNTEMCLLIPEFAQIKPLSFIQPYLPKSKASSIWQPPKSA